ncbi:helix-turn-helix transcriptional regulator [Nocardioides sp. S-58]|uniref:Helix-turn-helix transcriptional regulator n=1 Tax=Nocardioides renjunii TaxID=3095075 RepID=A0ABU5KBH3_9ACTN|nr:MULTISPECIES: helix-turn-helix transcriptional regulator [unclassified Nocardioides]MDZ5662213.1 helix-turn-helix transcriptional regulator [Nocardioides sp. S-58]WQQ20384.1 helix-turn-helix transcriptional regulator [Nocardioides sp. S-34]
MPDHDQRRGLLPALLKYWRGQRGLSQLDLAIAADVSSRHLSFLETGRATPSAEMVLRLATALDVPLRQVNTMLRSAGHPAAYEEGDSLPPLARTALDHLKRHSEPFPLVVVDRAYDVVDANTAAHRLLGTILPDDVGLTGLNLVRTTFDPGGAHPVIVNFDEVGRLLLWRLQREVLAEPGDPVLRGLLDDVLAMPTVHDDWRSVDLGVAADPAVVVHFRLGDLELRFVTLVTAFQAPQNVALDELRIEHWLPTDEATSDACHLLASS